ncbi:MAG: putative bifunctional diguanylate cyclase/phosphodiesterase [Myxococcota bacterium]
MPEEEIEAGPESIASDSISLMLVVEDDMTANRLEEVLGRPEGVHYEITRVLRIEDGLLKLQDTHFDAMLIDLSVHEGYGLDSLMRASAAARSVPIVVLTYQRDEATALKAARAGAQDYLTKGEVTPDLISRTIVHAIERHKILQDLTEAKQRQRFLATHDTLTELPNRYWFMEQLESTMATAERRGSQLAVMFFDLDGFKAINDNLGHAVGDELLTDVAKRLRKSIRKCDLIARIGGDEFLAAIQDVEDEEAPLRVADSIREEIERPYHLQGNECWISASVGIAVFPQHGETSDSLIQSADTAMYEAKTSGKNRVCLFNRDMNDKAVERFNLVSGLREAIHSGQLHLMFQPQIQTVSEEIVGVETLVRWNHPTRGVVSPGEFIEVAEEAGVMVQLGEWVLRTACKSAAEWQPISNARVAVNISGRQIDADNFTDRVKAILEETGLPASRLELELTESLAATEKALCVVDELRDLGVRIAIDDFGTGYSTMTLLKRLNVDLLKIDQSFVRGAAQTDPDRVILEAILHMAKGFGMEVMAEGVETIEEMQNLMQRGCTLMQGYLFSKPIERSQLDALSTDEDAAWRVPLTDPDSWSPPVETVAPAGPGDQGDSPGSAQSGTGTAIGRLGFRSGATFDPDEDLYPALKIDPSDSTDSDS